MLLAIGARAGAEVYTTYLWFDSLGAAAAWQHRIGAQAVLVLLFSLAFFVLAASNLLLVNRLAPAVVPRRNGDEIVERYREVIGGRQRSAWLALSAVLAVAAGSGGASQWRQWTLFRFGGSFGVDDPLHGIDLSFYMFRLPFISHVLNWLFAALVIVTLLVAGAHYLTGAIHLPGTGAPASFRVKLHLSSLFAALAGVKAVDYWLDRYRLTLSDRGVVSGALYTDVNAALPASVLMALIAALCAVTFLVNTRRQGWGLPMIALGLWALVAVIAGVAYPAALQKIRVDAKESALEAPYIRRNIEATRTAMGLDQVVERNFAYEDELTDEAITENASTVSNVRLLDPTVVPPTFTTLQSKFDYYRFTDLDVDRYMFNGQETEVIIGARELNLSNIPVDTWEGRHLSYTHGYGVAMAPANAVNADGEPAFAVSDVPVRIDRSQLADLSLERPEIYFGEDLDEVVGNSYAIVGTSLKEEGDQYQGGGGVAINTFVRKAAFALRFGELEPITSQYLIDSSRVLFNRGVRERVSEVAPFLRWDHDPYPVLVDGGIKYIVDGYTTADTYPYAQTPEVTDLDRRSGLAGHRFNYVRNSVKAVVDAYDGSVTMYVTDELYGSRDPIIHAYARAFPGLFTPASEMDDDLRSHLRYPEDMFKVQTKVWGRYHLDRPGEFYTQEDGWDVAQNPPSDIRRGANSNDLGLATSADGTIAPNYLQMRLPEEPSDEFVLFRPFVPHSRAGSAAPKKQLNAFMVGRSDPASYGQIVVYTMTEEGADGEVQRNLDVDGPLTAHENMVSDTTTRQRLALLSGQAVDSPLRLGNMVLVPIEQGMLYVRPIYVSSEGEGASTRLRLVVVSIGGRVALGDTLAEALAELFPNATIATRETGPVDEGDREPGDETGDEPGEPGGEPEPPAGVDGDAAELLADAIALFDEADATLREGGASSLADYQEKVERAQDLVRRAQEAMAAPTTTAP